MKLKVLSDGLDKLSIGWNTLTIKEKIDLEMLKTLFDLFRKRLERNDDIVEMRELEETLRTNGFSFPQVIMRADVTLY